MQSSFSIEHHLSLPPALAKMPTHMTVSTLVVKLAFTLYVPSNLIAMYPAESS